jgi:hypothetical protein
MSLRTLLLIAGPSLVAVPLALAGSAERPAIGPDTVRAVVERLVGRFGAAHAERIRLGVAQVAQRWWAGDGDEKAFATFCEEQFLTDPSELDRAFARLEQALEQIDGQLHEVRRMVTTPLDLDTGPVSPLDRLLGDLDLASHVDEDLFRTKVAFVALVNFPVHTLQQRLAEGPSWDRKAWARSRMMDRFDRRVPADVGQEITRAFTAADQYIANYNIRMDRLITPEGEQPFREGLSLVTHWGLRDELGSLYAVSNGLARQRMIQTVMERIVRQEIPAAAINNPDLLWCPERNEVRPVPGAKAPPDAGAREPDTRYARLVDVFHAVRRADPFSPTAPTYIDRRFQLERQIPERDVEALLDSVLASAEVRDLAGRIRQRLGRPLEPFDIWYTGFKPRGTRSEEELDRIVRARYPTLDAFAADIPRILRDLGFTSEKADWLARRVVVDPARGAGHAMGAVRREDRAHLRTRVPRDGMDYKGYNIAIHELGHNVEQVLSLNGIDHWSLNGVPNTAFTEALAFVFQGRDVELLGLAAPGPEARHHEALATLWGTYEIGAVGLVDMRVWRWMYEHPQCTPAELREATLGIARQVWNRYFAPLFGVRDQELLAIYSHMIVYGLYLPDYSLGHIIALQVARKLREADFGAEFERMARQGRVTPDAWMRGAVGRPLSAEALLSEAREALNSLP